MTTPLNRKPLLAAPLVALPLVILLSTATLAESHVVQPGETLYSLAKRFGTTVSDLVQANGIGADFVIRVGQVLIVPATNTVKSDPSTPVVRATPPGTVQESLPSPRPVSSAPGVKPVAPTPELVVPVQPPGASIGRPPARVAENRPGSLVEKPAEKPVDRPIEKPIERPSEPPVANAESRPAEPKPENAVDKRVISVADGEFDLLARLVAAEAGGEPLDGQIGVAAVVVNRVKHQAFPNSITEVVKEPGQFKSVELGRLEGLTPSLSVIQATERALAGEDPTGGALFFYNPVKSTALAFWSTRPITTSIGNHNFAK